MEKIMVGPSRYIQGEGVIERIGEYVSSIGNRAIVVGDEIVFSLLKGELIQNLEKGGVNAITGLFGGECTEAEIDRLTKEAKRNGVNVVIGTGGGKGLDTAKGISYYSKLPLVMLPTIAATDAPTIAVAILYDDNHSHAGRLELPRNPDLVIVDTRIIANAPVRFLVTGMGDALATKFEAEATAKSFGKNLVGGEATMAALSLANLSFDVLMEYGLMAKQAVEEKTVTPALEKIVEVNVLLSGLGTENCGCAAAHAIGDALTVFKEVKENTYHGERVGFGTLVQTIMEDRPPEEIHSIFRFCCSVGLAVKLSDLSIERIDRWKIRKTGEKVCESKLIGNMPFSVTPEMVQDAIIMTDRIGNTLSVNT